MAKKPDSWIVEITKPSGKVVYLEGLAGFHSSIARARRFKSYDRACSDLAWVGDGCGRVESISIRKLREDERG